MNKVIKNLRKYDITPNTIDKGTLYIGEVNIPLLKEDQKRLVRIYLPSNYGSEALPVIYMMDGKNLFDKYTSFMGEWEMDEEIEKRIDNGKCGYIVVGIDSAKTDFGRISDMLPSNKHLDPVNELPEDIDAFGSLLGDFLVNELKPKVDETFKTNKELSYIGGSSMGGLFAFYMGQKYKNVYKGSLCFSPAFCLYDEKYFMKEIKKIKPSLHSVYLLVGNLEFEQSFVSLTEYTYDLLCSKEYENIKYIHDLNGIHHESFWKKYIQDALDFFENNN